MRTKRLTIVLIPLLGVVTACSGKADEPASPRVASVAGPSAAPAPTSAKPELPRERLDTTPEEFEAMLGPYNQCMRDHGAQLKSDWVNGRTPTKADMLKHDEANKSCQTAMPLPPWEKDPKNPRARDFALAVVECLKGKGFKKAAVDEDGQVSVGTNKQDRATVSRALDVVPECERASAAAGN